MITDQDVLKANKLARVNCKPTWAAAMAMFLNSILSIREKDEGSWLEYGEGCTIIVAGDQWMDADGTWKDCPDYEWGKVNHCAPVRTRSKAKHNQEEKQRTFPASEKPNIEKTLDDVAPIQMVNLSDEARLTSLLQKDIPDFLEFPTSAIMPTSKPVHISDLLTMLKAMQDKHGDLQVAVDSYNDGYGGLTVPFIHVGLPDEWKHTKLLFMISPSNTLILDEKL